MYTGNPIEDAIDHINGEEERHKMALLEPQLICSSCHDWFGYTGGGRQVGNDKFCPECVRKNKHYDYFRVAPPMSHKKVLALLKTATIL